jgi:hypothetical protein
VNMDEPFCRTCHAPIPEPIKGHAHRRGFCSNKCNVAYVPVLRTVLCANETCTRDRGSRKVFTTYKRNAECCCHPCQNTYWQRMKSWRKANPDDVVGRPPAPGDLDARPVWGDLPAERIEALLEAKAAHRKATRSWLRIEDPYQQRPGSALHESALITHELDTEGAYL